MAEPDKTQPENTSPLIPSPPSTGGEGHVLTDTKLEDRLRGVEQSLSFLKGIWIAFTASAILWLGTESYMTIPKRVTEVVNKRVEEEVDKRFKDHFILAEKRTEEIARLRGEAQKGVDGIRDLLATNIRGVAKGWAYLKIDANVPNPKLTPTLGGVIDKVEFDSNNRIKVTFSRRLKLPYMVLATSTSEVVAGYGTEVTGFDIATVPHSRGVGPSSISVVVFGELENDATPSPMPAGESKAK